MSRNVGCHRTKHSAASPTTAGRSKRMKTGLDWTGLDWTGPDLCARVLTHRQIEAMQIGAGA